MAKKKKGDLLQVAECLQTIYAGKKWRGQWPLFVLSRRWDEVVGPQLAAMSAPAFFRHDVLWVEVRSSALMHHMQMLKPQLLEQIRAALPDRKVEDLRWRPASGDAGSGVSAYVPGAVFVDPVEEDRFRRMAAGVAQPECREALYRLWRSFAANRSE